MSRVPDVPPRAAKPLVTIGDYIDAGISVRSFCSAGTGHSHLVDLEALADRQGHHALVDYALKVSLVCPACGAPGGGLELGRS